MSLTQPIGDRFSALPGAARAAFWVACTGVSFTGMMAVARHLSPDLPIFVIVFFRGIFGLAFLSPIAARRGIRSLHTRRFGAYLIRGLAAFAGIVCFFYAAALIPLADIAAIGFTRPVFACIAAILILGEIARAHRWAGIAIGMIGALIVVRPGFAEINPGILFAFGAVTAQVVNSVVIKSLSWTEHPDTIAVWQGLVLLPLATIAAAFVWKTPTLEHLAWLVLIGLFGAVTQRSMARAYAAADATVVVVLDFMRLPIAAIIGLAVFSEWPVIWVWIGGAVILASAVLVTHRDVPSPPKLQGARPPKS